MTDHETRSDGLQLVRVMNETQARGSEEVPVTPALAAHDDGLEIGSERYDAAMHFLRNEGALVVHPFGEQSDTYPRGGQEDDTGSPTKGRHHPRLPARVPAIMSSVGGRR